MALNKPVKQNNGLILNYHRIFFVQSTVNSHTSIAVFSYLDEPSREMEGTENKPYKASTTYETAYTEKMTIEAAYEFLKTLPEFKGATDI